MNIKVWPALVAFVAYSRVLFNGAGFSHPDDLLAFGASVHGPRPIFALTIMFNKIAGGWMLTNVCLHVVCSILVAAIAWRLFGDVMRANLAGCLFAAHPLAADAVASIAGRSMLLCAVFVFSAIILVLDQRSIWLVGLAAALAFLVREDAAALFVIIPVIAWFQSEPRFVKYFVACGLTAMTLAATFHQRIYAANVIPPTVSADLAAIYTPQHHYAARYAEGLMSTILPAIVAPFRLSAEPFVATGPIFLIAFALFVLWVVVRCWKGDAQLMAIAFVPLAIYAFSPLSDMFLEHRAYIAIGGCMMIAVAIMRNHAVLIGTIVVTVFILASQVRTEIYATPVALWSDAVAKNPDAPRARINYGMALYSVGRYNEARRELIVASGRLRMGLTDLILIEARDQGVSAMSTMSRQMDLIDPVPEYHR